MKKIIFIAVFLGLMSAGAWAGPASYILQDNIGFYYELDKFCVDEDQVVFTVNVYFGGLDKSVARGLAFFGRDQFTLKITVFESASLFSYTIEASLASGFPALACWCNPDLATGNIWLTWL